MYAINVAEIFVLFVMHIECFFPSSGQSWNLRVLVSMNVHFPLVNIYDSHELDCFFFLAI